jgi:hypothetical protein
LDSSSFLRFFVFVLPSIFLVTEHKRRYSFIIATFFVLLCDACNRGSRVLSSGVSTTYAPSTALVIRVLTTTYGFQVTGLTLPECATVSLYLNTTQQPSQNAPAAPYSLIAYPAGGLPLVFPLTLTSSLAPWTVAYPVGEPHYLLQA